MSVKETNSNSFQRPSKPGHVLEGNQRCLSIKWLFKFADNAAELAPKHERRHLESCPHCAGRFAMLRAGKSLSALPARWTTHLGSATRIWNTDSVDCTFQILGSIQFDTRAFVVCHEEEWVASANAMRVNMVFDERFEFFSLTVLDAPSGITSISVLTSEGLQRLQYDKANAAFELSFFEGVMTSEEESLLTYGEVRSLLKAHKLELVVDMKPTGDEDESSQPNDVIELLHHHQAIERYADYVLPSGLYSDTYINSSTLCSSEESMQFLAAKIDFLFWDKQFDTVLANGWAMALVARRLAAAREAQGRKTPMRQVLCEGYLEPIMLDDIIPGSQVLIVLDVVVSGGLARELQRLVRAAGADVVGVAAVVRPHGASSLPNVDLRSLCEVEMELSEKRAPNDLGNELPQQVFNPIAGCMTTKCTAPRSPSQFLQEDPSAQDLWSHVQTAEAYEHHRREGDTHYIGFVDTRKLLECRGVGSDLVDRLVDVILKSGNRPTFLVMPQRSRAGILTKMMTRTFESRVGIRPRVLVATRKWTTGQWELSRHEFASLHDADVLIVDTAAGHGRTIDQLASLVGKAKASRIGAAVLLSRLTPPCEDAFNLRLSGGYHRLFNLPIRPVAIRGDRVDLCPVCRRKNAIRRFAEDSDIEALEQWAESLFKMRRGPIEQVRQPREKQMMLFELDRSFLSGCGAAVASGVTLHALGAASTNGSAPLSLPELFDDRISWRVRATMVEPGSSTRGARGSSARLR